MDAHKQLTIGLFGFGVVGEGLYKVMHQTPSLNATIKKICIKHPGKKRNAPEELFTTDKDELLNDSDINVIVEVIDDSEAAFQIVSKAIRNGKAVVSASKKMLAEHLNDLLPREQALKKIWGSDTYFNGRSMDVYIAKLRKYLKDDPTIEIVNIHGNGFRLVVPVPQ